MISFSLSMYLCIYSIISPYSSSSPIPRCLFLFLMFWTSVIIYQTSRKRDSSRVRSLITSRRVLQWSQTWLQFFMFRAGMQVVDGTVFLSSLLRSWVLLLPSWAYQSCYPQIYVSWLPAFVFPSSYPSLFLSVRGGSRETGAGPVMNSRRVRLLISWIISLVLLKSDIISSSDSTAHWVSLCRMLRLAMLRLSIVRVCSDRSSRMGLLCQFLASTYLTICSSRRCSSSSGQVKSFSVIWARQLIVNVTVWFALERGDETPFGNMLELTFLLSLSYIHTSKWRIKEWEGGQNLPPLIISEIILDQIKLKSCRQQLL